MRFDDAIGALVADAIKMVSDGHVIGLGSGRTAAAFVAELGRYTLENKIRISAVPTSLQIKKVAQDAMIPLMEPGQGPVDIIFDGADQIDDQRYMIKGGGGALLMENILISSADKVIIMADESKFVPKLEMPVPVEVHPAARYVVPGMIKELGGKPQMRLLERGYPFITENANIIFDCDFGEIVDPAELRARITGIAGVAEAGVFTRKPDVIYAAKPDGLYEKK